MPERPPAFWVKLGDPELADALLIGDSRVK